MQRIFFPSPRPRFVDANSVIQDFRQLALRLAEKNAMVSAVYLFGSYAEDNAAFRSDADILVVLFDDKRTLPDRLTEFILYFSSGPVPADVLVYTKAELKRAIKDGNRFLAKAAKGIELIKR